jgi:glycosyltransferase involved in cell wall biosynthesis
MLSILMPVYNERERVERAIAEVLQTELPSEFELIVVDDGSTDGTREILREGDWDGRLRLFEHPENQGKGAAVQTALSHAKGEYAAIFDADLEYDPSDLALLMPPLMDGRSNASFGVRAFDGYTSHSFLFVLGNKGVTLACNLLFNVYLHDIMTCHKMIRTDVFRSLPLQSGLRSSPRSPPGWSSAASASSRSRCTTEPAPPTRARSSPRSMASG